MTDNIDNAKIIATMPTSSDTVEDFLKLRNLLALIKSAAYASIKSKGCKLDEESVSDRLHLLRFEITKSNGMEGAEYAFASNGTCRILAIQGGHRVHNATIPWIGGVISLSKYLFEQGLIAKPIVPAFIIPMQSEVNKNDGG